MFALRKFLVFALITLAVSANASLISYDFEANWWKGPLAGSVSKGRFTIDSESVQAGHEFNRLDLFTDFKLSLYGRDFTTANVMSGFGSFNTSGLIDSLTFGTYCVEMPVGGPGGQLGGSCGMNTSNLETFTFNYRAGYDGLMIVGDGVLPNPNGTASRATTSLRLIGDDKLPSEVPEPETALLLISPLAFIITRFRKLQRQS